MLDEMLETYDEYDESDFESDFEDLEFDEARRRRRRRPRRRRLQTSGPAWRPQRLPSRDGRTAEQLKREAEAGRARDKQLAREVNSAKEEISDVASQLEKINTDVSKLHQLSLIATILPRSIDVQRQNLTIGPATSSTGGSPTTGYELQTTNKPVGPGVVSTVSGVSSKLDILPVVLFMMMGRGIGKPGRTSAGMGDNSMLPVILLLLIQQQQQQQQQQSGTSGQTSTGGLDTTTLLLVLLAAGGL
ncbi:MAG: hypothetical protein IGS50_00615 [Synechococcales cyanobacterium C42_A2020_086]|jgi:hypothetical protein|nr:hypothetical protein [Synechococcales cyanobacterium C42_A2020_086]